MNQPNKQDSNETQRTSARRPFACFVRVAVRALACEVRVRGVPARACRFATLLLRLSLPVSKLSFFDQLSTCACSWHAHLRGHSHVWAWDQGRSQWETLKNQKCNVCVRSIHVTQCSCYFPNTQERRTQVKLSCHNECCVSNMVENQSNNKKQGFESWTACVHPTVARRILRNSCAVRRSSFRQWNTNGSYY